MSDFVICLNNEGSAASLIVGLNTVEQVDEVIDAASQPAPRRVFDEALAVFDEAGPVATG